MDYEMAKLQGLNVVIGEHDTHFETRRSRLAREDVAASSPRSTVKRHSEIKGMLNQLKITKLDIGELQATMLEQAAVTGKMESARRIAVVKEYYEMQTSGHFKGEYWADELGYFKISAKSECPMSMRPDQDIQTAIKVESPQRSLCVDQIQRHTIADHSDRL